MSQRKIIIVGKLQFSEENGLQYSMSIGKPEKEKTLWFDVGPENAHDWPGLGEYPECPEEKPFTYVKSKSETYPEAYQKWAAGKNKAKEDWQSASTAYDQKLNADPAYRRAQFELMELQRREPQPVPEPFAFFPATSKSGSTVTWFCASNQTNQNLSVKKALMFWR
jgi:hypothetical protein